MLGICWVAAIQALERARAMPPAPPSSIREPVIRAPLAPTTAMPPREAELLGLVDRAAHERAGGLEVEVASGHGLSVHAPTML